MAGLDKIDLGGDPIENYEMSEKGYGNYDFPNSGYLGDKTPTIGTPNPYFADGKSIYQSMRSPGTMGSPYFTPARQGMTPGRSEMFTPFP